MRPGAEGEGVWMAKTQDVCSAGPISELGRHPVGLDHYCNDLGCDSLVGAGCSKERHGGRELPGPRCYRAASAVVNDVTNYLQ